MPAQTQEVTLFWGQANAFLFAAAIGIMVSGPVCSRSTLITRARTAMVILVSAPLYLTARYSELTGFVSVQRDKGACFHAFQKGKKSKTAWTPQVVQIWMNAATHEPSKGDKPLLPFRGGNYWHGVGAGVFALNFNNPRSNSNIDIGFRAALPSQPDIQSLRTLLQCGGDKGVCSLPTILLVVAKIKLPWKPPVVRATG